jgi:hypothetical protein
MTHFLGPLVTVDIEGKFFKTTADGINTILYTFDQFLNGKHLLDHPGHNCACEAPHLKPKPKTERDRGAQPFTEAQLEQYRETLRRLGRKQFLLPSAMAKRVFVETGFKSEDSCLAWWSYCDRHAKIIDMLAEFKPVTERDQHRNILLNQCREDSCYRIDSMASGGYVSQEVEDARDCLTRAWNDGGISSEMILEYEIKILRSGPRKGLLVFAETKVMPLYVSCCNSDKVYHRDVNGTRISPKAVTGGILQHHAHKSGKGSKASARAKTRLRLRTAEKRYRVEHGIAESSFPAPIPVVRAHHQRMNRELIKRFRDYAD